MENPKYNWVVRYYALNNPKTIYNFSGFKNSGKPGYAHKFDNIQKFKNVHEAFAAAKQILELGEYNADVCRIHAGNGESYYFTGTNL
jgi:hypothetical protein